MVISHQSVYNSLIQNGYKNRIGGFYIEWANGQKKYYLIQDLFHKISSLEKESFRYLRRGSRILDIGAGAGRGSLYLQKRGYNVVALEKSNVICEILKKRGVNRVIHSNIFKYYPNNKYDVALYIKNYSIFGKNRNNIIKLFKFIKKNIINRKGEIIIILDYKKISKDGVSRRFIYNGKKGPWFQSIYPSPKDIVVAANNCKMEVMKFKDNIGEYFFIIK